ncbi:hypothetical protein GGR55DRAFT_583491 [Xylaria sp. FL0064]|nr:hypothetical protein GGR55DRAFT_583491 [Xylaria sp. FL0064]
MLCTLLCTVEYIMRNAIKVHHVREERDIREREARNISKKREKYKKMGRKRGERKEDEDEKVDLMLEYDAPRHSVTALSLFVVSIQFHFVNVLRLVYYLVIRSACCLSIPRYVSTVELILLTGFVFSSSPLFSSLLKRLLAPNPPSLFPFPPSSFAGMLSAVYLSIAFS